MKSANISCLEIINGTLFNQQGEWKPSDSILIKDGKIVSKNDQTNRSVSEHRVIDATDCYILPGLTDLNVSLREPGATRNGSIKTETLAAASSGVTKLCSNPETQPVNDSKAVTQLILDRTASHGSCKVLPLGALTRALEGEQLSSYAALDEAGCIGLSNAFNPIKNLLVTQRCFEYARTHNMLVMLNPIEPALHKGYMHEGHLSTQLGIKGIPESAETIAVAQLIELARSTDVKLHLSQLSCAGAVEQVRAAKQKGCKISCDVSISQLFFTDENVGYFDSLFHCMPPFRGSKDRGALIKGVIDGTIDAITSAHRPWETAEKQHPFTETKPGLSSIELILPMAIQLQSQGLTLETFFARMTQGPANILGLSNPSIEPGQIADLFVFNPTSMRNSPFFSKGTNTAIDSIGAAFSNESSLVGRSELTICDGKISFDALSAN